MWGGYVQARLAVPASGEVDVDDILLTVDQVSGGYPQRRPALP